MMTVIARILVPRMKESDDDDDAEDAEAELPDCIDRNAPPLQLRKGDLRLEVRWRERGGHGDPGTGIAYLLRRVSPSGPPDVSPPSIPPLSWAAHMKYRERDNF